MNGAQFLAKRKISQKIHQAITFAQVIEATVSIASFFLFKQNKVMQPIDFEHMYAMYPQFSDMLKDWFDETYPQVMRDMQRDLG